MSDWSRLAVDPRTTQKLAAESELGEYKCAPNKAVQGPPVWKRELLKEPPGGAERTTPSVLDKYLSWMAGYKRRLAEVPASAARADDYPPVSIVFVDGLAHPRGHRPLDPACVNAYAWSPRVPLAPGTL